MRLTPKMSNNNATKFKETFQATKNSDNLLYVLLHKALSQHPHKPEDVDLHNVRHPCGFASFTEFLNVKLEMIKLMKTDFRYIPPNFANVSQQQ